MRVAQRDAHVRAVRAKYEASAASDGAAFGRQLLLAQTWRALEAKAAREADMFASVQETRGKWQQLTQPILQLAIAADTELRRRHPGMRIEPLRSHPAETARRAGDTADPQPAWSSTGTTLESTQHEALGLSPAVALAEIPEHVLRISENARGVQDRIDEIARLRELEPGGGLFATGVFALPTQRQRDAILHPPARELISSARVISAYRASPQAITAQDPEGG